MTEYSVSPRGEDPQKDEKAVWKPKLECLRSLLWPAAFFFFFPFFLSPDTDHHSERSRPGGLKVPQAIFEGLLRNKERVIWPEKLVPGGLPAKLRGSGMWGYGSDQQLSLELCMPALVGGC